MAEITHVMSVGRREIWGNVWVMVKYSGEGWFAGKLSADATTVSIDGTSYDFDRKEDEYVEYSTKADDFLKQHTDSVIVRTPDTDFVVADAAMTVADVVRTINLLLYRAGQKQMPPIDPQYAKYTISEASTLCSPAILSLEVS